VYTALSTAELDTQTQKRTWLKETMVDPNMSSYSSTNYWVFLISMIWYLFTANGFPPGGSGR